MDVGSTPNTRYTKDYQSGALSFEIVSNGKKLISNCGYYEKPNNKLCQLSKSTAAHSTLVVDDNSSCKFAKTQDTVVNKKRFKNTKKKLYF